MPIMLAVVYGHFPSTNPLAKQRNEQIAASGIPVLAFGEDEDGEIYYMTDNGHSRCIFRFEPK